MSTPERSEPFATPSEARPEQPESERLVEASAGRQSEPPESGAGKASPRSSIRPAPADYRPRSDRPPPSPMVVVYSGDSDRPPPRWELDEPSDRPTIAHFAPVTRQPFPLAEDRKPADTDAEARRSSIPSPPADDGATGAPTLRLSTWPAPPEDDDTLRASEPRRAGRRVWPFAVLGFVGVTALGLAALPNGSAPTPEAPSSLATAAGAQETASEATAPVLPEPTATPATPEAHAADAPPSSEPTDRAPSASAEDANAAEAAPKAQEENASVHVVTLEVFPLDAKVVRKGLRHPGPPYVFKVPAGKRISVEVAKKGFVTRKVVLDGSEPTVTVGLFRKSSRRPGVAAKSSGHDDSSSRVGSGL